MDEKQYSQQELEAILARRSALAQQEVGVLAAKAVKLAARNNLADLLAFAIRHAEAADDHKCFDAARKLRPIIASLGS